MFAWSPEASVVAYSAAPRYNFPAGGPEDLWVDHPGSPPESVPVGMGAGVGSIAWSPDGAELAFDDSVFPHPATATSGATPPVGRLRIVPATGGAVVTAFRLSESGIDLAGWWPEGGGLLFWEDPGFSGSASLTGQTLYSLGSGSNHPVALASSLVGSTWLTPEPGGHTIALVAGKGRPIWTTGRDVELQLPRRGLPGGTHPGRFSGPGPELVLVGDTHLRGGIGHRPLRPQRRRLLLARLDGSVECHQQLVGDGRRSTAASPASTPAGVLLAVSAEDGSSMVVVADNALWLADPLTDAPAVRVAGPLYSTMDPSGYYGEVDWGATFAWSDAVGLRQGSAQLLDEDLDLPEAQLP